MNADELEKLIAKHKLRTLGDQSGYADACEVVSDVCGSDSAPQLHFRSTVPEPAAIPCIKSLMMIMDNQNYGDAPSKTYSILIFGNDSRGKLYEKYIHEEEQSLGPSLLQLSVVSIFNDNINIR